MAHHYIVNQPGVGYIVAQLESEDSWYMSNRYVVKFGDRQTDAIEFRDDCNNGKIEPRRIKMLMDKYTDKPYIYDPSRGGILRKQKQ